jgi:propanediol utilization protein
MTKILIEVSARHIHLSQADLTKLFGTTYKLKVLRPLRQIGQFAAKEKVTIIGAKGVTKTARIIGPVNSKTQLEISLTDAQALGLKPPLRVSGDLREASKVKLIGPVGQITAKVAFISWRHIHANPSEAKKLKIKDGQIVKVAINGDRGLILDNIVVRINDNFKLALHLDTDEANAAGLRAVKNYGQLSL